MPPAIRVNGGTAGVKASVSALSAVTATLDSIDGVRQCAWSVLSTDETSTVGSYTLVQSGSVGQNVAFTSLGAGTAMLLKVIVNAGIDSQTGQANATTTSATVKVYVPTASGLPVGCAGEEYEHDPTFGATEIINAGVRAVDAVSPGGIPVKIVKAATVAALPANTRTGNVLTANANGAFPTIGGSVTINVGEFFLVKDEGGGASHVNNGAYSLTTAGDGSNPWTATRATYWDDSSELVKGTTFRVQEGTYEGQELVYKTAGATINVTAQEFGTDGAAPATATYLCSTASALLSNEVAIDAITSTVTFASTSTTPIAASRTDAATADVVNVATFTALSTGTTAAGFGPSCTFQGKQGSGAAETIARIDAVWTDVTGSSEDTKIVLRTRTAGASVGAVADFAGTGSTLYREDSSTNSTLNMLDLRRTTSGTAATGIGASVSFTLEDDAGNQDTAGTIAVDYLDATSTSEDARFLFRGQVAGSLTDLLSLRGQTLRIHGLAGGGTQILQIDNNGDVSATSGSGADVNAPYLVNDTAASNINDVPIQNLASQITFKLDSGAPVKLTHNAAGAGTAVEVLRLRQSLAAGVGTGGEAARIAYSLPNGSGTETVAGTSRFQWTTVIGGGTSKFVIATALAGSLNDRLEVSGTGVVTLNAYTTAGMLTNDGSGVVSSANPTLLAIGSVTNVSAAKDISALTTVLPFAATGDLVASFARTETSTNDTQDVIELTRATSGTAVANIGGGLLFRVQSDAGGTPETARLSAFLTDVTDGAEHATIALSCVSAGTPTQRATLTSAGVWTTSGAMRSDSGFDRSTAGALVLGGTNATSISASSLKITGLTAGTASGHAVEYDQLNSAVGGKVGGSGTTNTVAKFTASATVGNANITDDGSTITLTGSTMIELVGLTRVSRDGIGTTKTRGLTARNATVSGSQVSPQIGWTAFHSGGTQINAGAQLEPQSSSRTKLAFWYGTGSGVPASGNGSTGWFVLDSADDYHNESAHCNAFVAGTTIGAGTGFRFAHASNRGGMDLDGSQNLRIKSYSAKGFTLAVYSDGGSTVTSNPLTVNGSGQGYAQLVPTQPTSSGAALTINLTTSQNAFHTTTEATTVTITGGVTGQHGVIVFSQGATGRTITMPTNGVGVEYDNTIGALGTTSIIDATALTRTLLAYYTLPNGKAYIYSRSVNTIP